MEAYDIKPISTIALQVYRCESILEGLETEYLSKNSLGIVLYELAIIECEVRKLIDTTTDVLSRNGKIELARIVSKYNMKRDKCEYIDKDRDIFRERILTLID